MSASAIDGPLPADTGRREAADLRIGGLVPLSTTDWPGRLAAVVFAQGCPYRCGYCHNPHLIPRTRGALAWREVLAFLERRQGLLDAVVFSGGEPIVQQRLAQAMQDVRRLGFAVGLHTAGPSPRRLAALLPQLDWVALDIKAARADYARITGRARSGERAYECARLLLAHDIPHELRTTVHPALLDIDAVVAIGRALADLGARRYVLQAFRATGCVDASLNAHGVDIAALLAARDRLAPLFERLTLR